MAIINPSPWSDAAGVGRGLGNTITQILFQLPAIRAREAEQRQRLELYGQHVHQQGELAKAHSALYGAQQAAVEQKTHEGQEKERHTANFLNHMKLATDRVTAGLDPSEPWMIAQSELAAADPKELGELAKTLLLHIGGAFNDPAKAYAAGSPAGARAADLAMGHVNPLLGTQGAMEPRPGETINVPQLGTNAPAQFTGEPRPFAPEHLGNAIPVLLDPSRSPLDSTNRQSLADSVMQALQLRQGGTNTPIPTFLDENQAQASGYKGIAIINGRKAIIH